MSFLDFKMGKFMLRFACIAIAIDVCKITVRRFAKSYFPPTNNSIYIVRIPDCFGVTTFLSLPLTLLSTRRHRRADVHSYLYA